MTGLTTRVRPPTAPGEVKYHRAPDHHLPGRPSAWGLGRGPAGSRCDATPQGRFRASRSGRPHPRGGRPLPSPSGVTPPAGRGPRRRRARAPVSRGMTPQRSAQDCRRLVEGPPRGPGCADGQVVQLGAVGLDVVELPRPAVLPDQLPAAPSYGAVALVLPEEVALAGVAARRGARTAGSRPPRPARRARRAARVVGAGRVGDGGQHVDELARDPAQRRRRSAAPPASGR